MYRTAIEPAAIKAARLKEFDDRQGMLCTHAPVGMVDVATSAPRVYESRVDYGASLYSHSVSVSCTGERKPPLNLHRIRGAHQDVHVFHAVVLMELKMSPLLGCPKPRFIVDS